MSKRQVAKKLRIFALMIMLVFVAGSANTANAQSGAQGKTDTPSGILRQEGAILHAIAYQEGQKASPAINIRPATTEVLVFDSYTNANYSTTSGSPRTFMGYAFNIADPGIALQITKVVLFIAFKGTVATTYNKLHVTFTLWNDYNGGSAPVFSNGRLTYGSDFTGPLTFQPNTFAQADMPISFPVDMTNLINNGISITIQADTGSGLVTTEDLTSIIRSSDTNPIAVGSSPIPGTKYGYRNASGLTNFNFNATDLSGFDGLSNQALAFQLYALGPDTSTATPSPTWTPTFTPTYTPTNMPNRPDTIGVYNAGVFYLRNTNNTGAANITVSFGGDPSDLPVAGDWDGNGIDSIGIYRGSTGIFYLSNSNTSPAINYNLVFGNPSDTPFAGKWIDTMTHDGVGVYRNSNGILYQKMQLTTGFSDFFAIFGNPGDIGFAGDWDGDGTDSIGVYRSSNMTWYLTNNSTPFGITFSDYNFVLNTSGATPLAGDWDGDGDSTPGWLTSNGVFSLHPNNSIVGPDNVFAFDPANGKPIAGKWTASSKPPQANIVVGSSSHANPDQSGSAD